MRRWLSWLILIISPAAAVTVRSPAAAGLKNFAGHLQTDGYAACEVITRRPEVTALGCMAHARREFVEARDSDPGRAGWMLSQMQQ
ncbi:MAG: IS66 family transposase, partial [candidate division KSB1 bacterium]|nr:IS66 family transposase [candidate division KSB1 bacterium]